MQIVVVDNGTSYLPKLEALLQDHVVHVVKYSEINYRDFDVCDAVILSGGHDFPVVGNSDRLSKELEFIRTTQKPIFGICFGFELIVYAFGGKLEHLDAKESGSIGLEVTQPDPLFTNVSSFRVYESHRWVAKDVGPELVELARSKDGVEVVRHKTRLIYAVQFHPEMFTEVSGGDEIFQNFLNMVT